MGRIRLDFVLRENCVLARYTRMAPVQFRILSNSHGAHTQHTAYSDDRSPELTVCKHSLHLHTISLLIGIFVDSTFRIICARTRHIIICTQRERPSRCISLPYANRIIQCARYAVQHVFSANAEPAERRKHGASRTSKHVMWSVKTKRSHVIICNNKIYRRLQYI